VRVPNPIILEIDAKGSIESGNKIYHAGTTVFITEEVTPEFIHQLNDKFEKLGKKAAKSKKSKEKTTKDAEPIEEA